MHGNFGEYKPPYTPLGILLHSQLHYWPCLQIVLHCFSYMLTSGHMIHWQCLSVIKLWRVTVNCYWNTDPPSSTVNVLHSMPWHCWLGDNASGSTLLNALQTFSTNPTTRMWANAQRDGRPAEHRWRPLFNAAKFGWRPLLDALQ